MELQVKTLSGKDASAVKVSDQVFGLEPREDLIARMVRYQLAARRQGTHAVKNRSDISRTGKKMYKQKGTGNARHSTSKAPQFRGGGRAFGPTPRDHAHGLPKKVRALALRHALSSKFSSDNLVVVDALTAKEAKTKQLLGDLQKLGLENALIIDGASVDENFAKAASNIPHIDVLPVQGINVYDILRHEKLVLSTAAVTALEERFK